MVLVLPLDLVTEAGGKVLFIADHHIHKSTEVAIYLLRLCLTTDGPPQRISVIQIVRDNGAVLFCDLHRFFRDIWCCFGYRTKVAASVLPSGTFISKDL